MLFLDKKPELVDRMEFQTSPLFYLREYVIVKWLRSKKLVQKVMGWLKLKFPGETTLVSSLEFFEVIETYRQAYHNQTVIHGLKEVKTLYILASMTILSLIAINGGFHRENLDF